MTPEQQGGALYGKGYPRPADPEMAKGWDEMRAYYLNWNAENRRRWAEKEEESDDCGQCEGTGTTQSASNGEEEPCPVCDGTGHR